MRARTLMVGCAAGEGHLDGDDGTHLATADMFARFLPGLARKLNCALIVLKEFPAKYRTSLQRLMDAGFARVPSMPMTTLDIDYRNFEDYLSHCLSPRTRGKVRRKLRAAERARPKITVEVVSDAASFIDDIYPLYEKVFERSPLQFEKLTREFLREIGRRMPDKVRFFLWRQDNHIIAFGLCTVQDDRICHERAGRPHLPRICGFRLCRRLRAQSLLSRLSRHHRMGHRERLQTLLQRQPQLRPEMAPAPLALPR